jgi:5-methylcytosine-specific restriction protein A
VKSVKQRTLGTQKRDYRHADRFRGNAGERGYGWQWSKPHGTRQQAMERDCWLCRQCALAGYDSPAEHVDHIVPADVRTDWHHELGNLQALCKPCHEAKTARDKVVYGSRQDAVDGRLTVEQQRNRAAAQRLVVAERQLE